MLTLTDVQSVQLSIQSVDAKGNPAAVDGAPKWTVSDETVATVTPSDDGLSATLAAVGPLGQVQVTVEADADLGEGVAPIVGTLDVQVVASQAVSVTIKAGTPA